MILNQCITESMLLRGVNDENHHHRMKSGWEQFSVKNCSELFESIQINHLHQVCHRQHAENQFIVVFHCANLNFAVDNFRGLRLRTATGSIHTASAASGRVPSSRLLGRLAWWLLCASWGSKLICYALGRYEIVDCVQINCSFQCDHLSGSSVGRRYHHHCRWWMVHTRPDSEFWTTMHWSSKWHQSLWISNFAWRLCWLGSNNCAFITNSCPSNPKIA
jgi:hypothetical protein